MIFSEESIMNKELKRLKSLNEEEFIIYAREILTPSKFHYGIPMTKHDHYYKICHYDKIDVYRIIDLYQITDPCIQHMLKKCLVAGGRGHKDIGKDIQDIIDTAERWKQMRKEDQENG